MNRAQKLFVIGNPRSGTSLLRIMLNSNDSIVIPPECGFMQWWYKKYYNWSSESNLAEFITDLQTSKKIETWELDFDTLGSFLAQKKSKSYEELVFNVLAFYGLSKHKKLNPSVLGDKNNYYIEHLSLLRDLAPKAKFLIILRDPRDVYCSYKGIAKLSSKSTYIPKLSQNLVNFIHDWRHNQFQILVFLKKLEQGQFMIVNYEDLVLTTKTILSEVCDFLNVSFEEKMLKYYKTNDEPKALLDWKKKTLQPPDSSSIERYKNILTPSEIKEIEHNTFGIYQQLKQGTV